MTASSSQRPTALNLNVALQPSPAQVLLGGGVAFLLALFFFTIVWLRWESLFKSYPLLAIPLLLSMILAPAFLFISIRRMTEIGMRKRLVLSALLSATAIVLIALSFVFNLRHLAGG
jgi:hypothetical protein